MVEHQGIAPCIPVWKVLADGHRRVSLNTYAREMESRVRVALTCEVLRTTAWAARPTGHLIKCGRKHGFLPPVITYFLLIQVNTVAASLFEKALVRKLSTRSFSTSPKSRRTLTLTTRPANSLTGRKSSIN